LAFGLLTSWTLLVPLALALAGPPADMQRPAAFLPGSIPLEPTADTRIGLLSVAREVPIGGTWGEDDVAQGSAALVAPNVIVTAAHNFCRADGVWLITGTAERPTTDQFRSFSAFFPAVACPLVPVAEVFIPGDCRHDPRSIFHDDIAVVLLDRPVCAAAGHFRPMRLRDPAEALRQIASGRQVLEIPQMMAPGPENRSFVTQVAPPADLLPADQAAATDPLDRVGLYIGRGALDLEAVPFSRQTPVMTDRIALHDVNTAPGASGSPVSLASPSAIAGRLFAVHVGSMQTDRGRRNVMRLLGDAEIAAIERFAAD
jgi:hypothetical protein